VRDRVREPAKFNAVGLDTPGNFLRGYDAPQKFGGRGLIPCRNLFRTVWYSVEICLKV
jgi:hypothetical protein